MRTSFIALLLISAALTGCQEPPTSLVISERESWSGEPLVLDPAHVQEHAPILYDLLEEAYERGHAETEDVSERKGAVVYLQEVSGTNENHYLLEYRGKVFSQRMRTA